MCSRWRFAKVEDVKRSITETSSPKRIEMRIHNTAIAVSLLATSLFAENPPANTDSVHGVVFIQEANRSRDRYDSRDVQDNIYSPHFDEFFNGPGVNYRGKFALEL